MNGKIARMQDLVAAGWDVEDITSDDAHIHVLLTRGQEQTTLLLGREDAWEVLWGNAFAPDAPPAPERREALVTR